MFFLRALEVIFITLVVAWFLKNIFIPFVRGYPLFPGRRANVAHKALRRALAKREEARMMAETRKLEAEAEQINKEP